MAKTIDRLKGIRCRDCGKLLVGQTENGLTVWDDHCKKAHFLLNILSEAIEQGFLSPKEAIKNIPALSEELKRQIGRTTRRVLKPILYKK